MNWLDVEAGHSPPRRGGVAAASTKSCEATKEAADGVVSSAKCLGLNSFAELTTPSAPISERVHFIDGAAFPPLRGGEYSTFSISSIRSHLHRPAPQSRSLHDKWLCPKSNNVRRSGQVCWYPLEGEWSTRINIPVRQTVLLFGDQVREIFFAFDADEFKNIGAQQQMKFLRGAGPSFGIGLWVVDGSLHFQMSK